MGAVHRIKLGRAVQRVGTLRPLQQGHARVRRDHATDLALDVRARDIRDRDHALVRDDLVALADVLALEPGARGAAVFDSFGVVLARRRAVEGALGGEDRGGEEEGEGKEQRLHLRWE